jgi:hypothetical protein
LLKGALTDDRTYKITIRFWHQLLTDKNTKFNEDAVIYTQNEDKCLKLSARLPDEQVHVQQQWQPTVDHWLTTLLG